MSWQFDRFEVDVRNYQLLKDGAEVDLEPKVFDLLSYLIEHRDGPVLFDTGIDPAYVNEIHHNSTRQTRRTSSRYITTQHVTSYDKYFV